MDHPAFVADGDGGFEFRGGVEAVYFEDAQIETWSRPDGARFRVTSYDDQTQTGTVSPVDGSTMPRRDDILTWVFPAPTPEPGVFHAPACDDLAGVAAALAALDRARRRPEQAHLQVLLTRAEEVGLVGAIHAARNGTVPGDARIISIEASRELPTAPLGAGPVIRTGDRATVFDRDITNRMAHAAVVAGITHQRKLMDGGGCEASAFGGYGYAAGGLCLPLRNWHNRGNLDAVQTGNGRAEPALEAVSLDDFHGLADLILLTAGAVDQPDDIAGRLDDLYESKRHLLG
jgi:endoglucanase